MGLAVAVVLVAVALAVTAMSSHQKSTDRTLASGLADEALQDFVYGLPPASNPFWSVTSHASPLSTSTRQLGTSRFTTDLFVQDAAALGSGNKLVTVNVSWGSGDLGRAGYGVQTLTLSRLIYAH